MKCSNWFRQIAPTISLLGSLLVVSCSEGPTPGPMSPLNSVNKPTSSKRTPNQSTSGTVRPVNRLANRASHSLAKSGYNRDKVLQELQTVRDEMQAIVDNNPFTSVAYILSDAVRKTDDARKKLEYPSWGGYDWDDDDEGDGKNDNKAVGRIKKAKDKIQEAIYKQLLLSAQGNQFLAQLLEIENQINDGSSPAHDYRGQSKHLWIKRNYGGFIKFGGHSIDVPKYATKQDAQFSIDISPNDYITVDFGPDGWFDQQVTVTISYKDADLTGIDPSKLTLAWFDETTGQWVDLGGVVDLVKKTVTAKAWHFTQYTLSTK